MAIKLHICFDLGSDTLKIVYAYKKEGTSLISFGKFMVDELINQSAIPATAYYDEEKETWLFADKVEDGKVRNFVNTVKIKDLLNLVKRHSNEEVFNQNKDYYSNGNLFPKFFFPIPVSLSDKNDFSLKVKKNMVFEAPNYTPQKVCEEYFKYIYRIVSRKIENIQMSKNVYFQDVELALVYPPKSGMDYVNEFKRVIQKSFNKQVGVSMITTKALSLYAMNRELVKLDEPFIVFDMGETSISVVKSKLTKTGIKTSIAVEGSDGHLPPMQIGGSDLDNDILAFLEGQIRERETIGSSSYGTDGHISESGVHAKEFLLVKNIKKAKMILSKKPGRKDIFKNGVPISIHRDVRINRTLTKEQLYEILTAYGSNPIAKQISDYIINELTLPINRDVKTVFLSGGFSETYGLIEYIQTQLKNNPLTSRLPLESFEAKSAINEMYPIQEFEDSTFAPAIGGAITSLMNYSYETCLSLSYGTWYRNNVSNSVFRNEKFLKLFEYHFVGTKTQLFNELKTIDEYSYKKYESSLYKAEKGKILPLQGISFFTHATFSTKIQTEELFSINITNEEIAEILNGHRGNAVDHDNMRIYVGENANSQSRRKIVDRYQLKVVTGGDGATINTYYKGVKVKLVRVKDQNGTDGKIHFFEGISMDCDGFAIPFVVNAAKMNVGTTCLIQFVETKGEYNAGAQLNNVKASELEISFEGIDSFDN